MAEYYGTIMAANMVANMVARGWGFGCHRSCDGAAGDSGTIMAANMMARYGTYDAINYVMEQEFWSQDGSQGGGAKGRVSVRGWGLKFNKRYTHYTTHWVTN